MKIPRSKTAGAVIPTASMADIVFLLIIFFVLTFNVEVDKTMVDLPRTNLRFEVPKKAAVVSITDSGQMRVSDGETSSTPVSSVQDVLSFASEIVATDPEKDFVLKADRKVPYREVDQVIDALKQAKVTAVYLLSEQETVPTGGG
jgi:biopolymer transport protein ExbD